MSAAHPAWKLISADVHAAFLKGDPYVSRQLFLAATDPRRGPSIPIPGKSLARVLKGIFGLADAPREWYLRLAREVKDEEWMRSVLDVALWYRFQKGGKELQGILGAHVDDLLFSGVREAEASLNRLGQRLGFGSIEEAPFTWCGKKFNKDEAGVHIDMRTYHEQLKPVLIPRHRRSEPSATLTPQEHRQLRAVLGSLQWLVAQVRFDLSFEISSLEGEKPTIGTLLRANKAVAEAKRHGDFRLHFSGVDQLKGGIMMVSDAALGNVGMGGSADEPAEERIASQSCYAIMLADADLMQGRRGKFDLIDFRSHRLTRVCRSSYAAETLGVEEGMDAAELCRGFLAELRGLDMASKDAFWTVCMVPLVGVTDAKDTYDKLTKDTGFGTQKSLSFTLASLRQSLRRPNTSFRWTATANMFVDTGTKRMNNDNLRRTLLRGEWSVEYTEEFVKQTSKQKKAVEAVEGALPGRPIEAKDEALMRHVHALAELCGWLFVDGTGVHVAHSARSFRSPAPRFATRDVPYRTTIGAWRGGDGGMRWQVLEEKQDVRDLSNLQEQFEHRALRLVTFFSPS